MAGLSARYAEGRHEAVWDELHLLPYLSAETGPSVWPASTCDVEEVLRLTFGRVARNVDRLIERLAETGYRFESRSGRHGPAGEPRRPATNPLGRIVSALDDRFGDHPAFLPQPASRILPAPTQEQATTAIGPFPPALRAFAEQVGTVDLRQRYPAPAADVPSAELLDRLREREPALDPEAWERTGDQADMPSALVEDLRDPDEDRRQAAVMAEDARAHPNADDPIPSRLGDWDPLTVEIDYLAHQLTDEEEAELRPLDGGGHAVTAEFAPSFEHKANVSGGSNPTFRLPSNQIDPVVHAEGIHLPFTTDLRRCFARGGFLGVPRAVRGDYRDEQLIEVEPGIFLPDHPIFARLAEGLEPF